jgi:ribosome-associated protein
VPKKTATDETESPPRKKATRKKAPTKTATKAATSDGEPAAPRARASAKAAAKPASKAPGKATRAGGTARAAKKAPPPEPSDESKRVALACAEAGLDKKAVNVVILDVRGKVDYADYLVVMSGRSERQVQALARGISEDVQEKTKTKCLSVEALPGSSWVLMDFGDVVVHVFYDDVRGYYDLESLWMDARRIPVPGQLAQD